MSNSSINGWQTYARPNGKPGLGGQILWRPKPYLDFVWNNYGLGEDDIGSPGRSRIHAVSGAQVKMPLTTHRNCWTRLPSPLRAIWDANMAAVPASGPYDPKGNSPLMGSSSTYTGGVNCHNSKNGRPKQAFMGWMMYSTAIGSRRIYSP